MPFGKAHFGNDRAQRLQPIVLRLLKLQWWQSSLYGRLDIQPCERLALA